MAKRDLTPEERRRAREVYEQWSQAKVREFARRQRWRKIASVASGIGLGLTGLAGGLAPPLLQRMTGKVEPGINVGAVQAELDAAHKALLDAMSRANSVASTAIETAKKQQEEIKVLQARYDSLSALTAGQEKLARQYRAILNERTWAERIVDALFGFFLGVISSLAASWVWARMLDKNAPPDPEQN